MGTEDSNEMTTIQGGVIASEAKQSLMKERHYYVYVMANLRNTVIYTGMTNDIKRRVFEHKQGVIGGFTKKYYVHKLVYFEIFDRPRDAIQREKQIKGGSRKKKIELIHSMNPQWADLYEKL